MTKITIVLILGAAALGCRAPAPQVSRFTVRIYRVDGAPGKRRDPSPIATVPVSPVCSDSGSLEPGALVWRDRNRPGRSCRVTNVPWPDLPDGSYSLAVANLGVEADLVPFVVEGGKQRFR